VDGRKSSAAMILVYRCCISTLRRSLLPYIAITICVVVVVLVRGLVQFDGRSMVRDGKGHRLPSKSIPRLFKLITQYYHGAAEKTLNTSELVHRPSAEVY
jgi:hypothetical protein